jgi:nitroreductase/NAD-dependent dihydropyrimidine dehydrogenase PreA subunit
MINIDPELCNKDGICSKVCVFRIIREATKDRYPEEIPELADLCMACGHCVAACPTGALTHELLPVDDFESIADRSIPGPKEIELLLKSRRSKRNFQKRPVPRKVMDRLMDVARYAPSGRNRQDYRFLICDEREKLNRMTGMVVESLRITVETGQAGAAEKRLKQLISSWGNGIDLILHQAPAIILAYSSAETSISKVNCILAMCFIELMAHSLELGACYCGYFADAANSYSPLKKELGLPEDHSAAATLMIGYPQITYHSIPKRNKAQYRYL